MTTYSNQQHHDMFCALETLTMTTASFPGLATLTLVIVISRSKSRNVLTCDDETVKYLRHGLRLLPRLLPLPPLLLDGSQLELVVLTLLPSVSVLGLLGLLHKVLQLLKIFSGGNIGLDLVHWNKVCFQIGELKNMDL